MSNLIVEFLSYRFLQQSLFVGTVIGLVAPILGSFLVVKRYSAYVDTLAHVSLVGIFAGISLGFLPWFGSFLVAAVVAVAMELIRGFAKVYPESLLILFISGSLALVSILSSVSGGLGANLSSYLFGSLTALNSNLVWSSLAVGIVTLAVIFTFYRQFFAISFNQDLALVSGIKVTRYNLLLAILSALVVSLGIQLIGGLLMTALVVLPVMTVLLLGLSFKQTLIFSAVIGVISVWSGLLASFAFNLPAGASVVVVLIFWFILASFVAKISG